MRQTLRYVGLGPNMCKWIDAIYSCPTAAVRANEAVSSTFSLSNGTRRGCPPSPLIFVLVLEPLLCHIRVNADIRGIQSGSVHHKVAAYADHLLFFITNPEPTIPNLLKSLKTYATLSKYIKYMCKSQRR